MKRKTGIVFLVILCMVSASVSFPAIEARAAKTEVVYRYNKKNYTYKGSVRYATVQGANINVTKTPILLIANNNMAPYYEVLVKSGLKAKKSYSKTTKILTVTFRDKTLKMTMGKKTAYANGKKVTLPVAPRNITYKKSGLSRIIVPIKSVCKYLGLTYKWVSSTKRMFLTAPASQDKDASSSSADKDVSSSSADKNTSSSSKEEDTDAAGNSSQNSGSSARKYVIVIDAGHGGSDSGAVGNGYKEKDFTLSIVKAAKKYFDKDSSFKVYYTRLTDTYPSLKERYDLGNKVNADIFISVHINSAGKTATGTETLYNPDRNKKQNGLTCSGLAKIVQNKVKKSTGFKDRGLKQRCTRLKNGLALLNHNDGPATLTEIGFISNPTEAKKMAGNLSKYGKAVYEAVVEATK